MVLVENSALNNYTAREGGRPDGPVTHTRGLCLSESYRMITSSTVSFRALTRSLISKVCFPVLPVKCSFLRNVASCRV
jgi:hypothetical protein